MIVCPPKGQWDSFAIAIKMKGVGRIAAKAISFWFVASCFDPQIMKYLPLDIYRSFITLHHIFIITKHKKLVWVWGELNTLAREPAKLLTGT